MQLMIDIAAEAPSALRLAAQFLIDHAALREATESGTGAPPELTATRSAMPAPPPVPPHAAPPPPVMHTDLPPPPPLPFAPPPPPVNSATAPAGSTAPENSALVSAASVADEFDASGVPFDIRIHQKTRNKKKDGTWKIRKGLDDAIVESVMRELAPRIRIGSQPTVTPAPAGASAPVSLPPIPPPPGPAFVPPPPPDTAAFAPPPPPATAGASSETQAAPDPFRTLVLKITKARAANRLTPEEVVQSVTGCGCPSLQLLNNMPHLIPAVDAAIDSILAVR